MQMRINGVRTFFLPQQDARRIGKVAMADDDQTPVIG